jgi:hypothetical protein
MISITQHDQGPVYNWGLVDPYRFLIVLCQRLNDDSLACDPVIPIEKNRVKGEYSN